MFTFLTRMGRVFVGITVFLAVIAVLGVTSITGLLVASHHQGSASSMACAVSSAGVGKQLAISGHGFAPNTQYLLFTTSSGGNGETTANTDSTGAFTVTGWTYWSGTYGAAVWTEGHSSSLAATCSSATV